MTKNGRQGKFQKAFAALNPLNREYILAILRSLHFAEKQKSKEEEKMSEDEIPLESSIKK